MSKKIKTELKKKKEKWRLLQFTDKVIESDMLSSAHMEVFGNQRISIDGCFGVYEYKDTYLKLRLSKGAVTLCGSDFNITYFENHLISIKGKISAIEFV